MNCNFAVVYFGDLKIASRRLALSFVLGIIGLLLPIGVHAQVPAQTTVSSDELAVYATVLSSSEKLGKSSRPLIADTTSTFACGHTSFCNALSMGNCNGLRSVDESPSDRLAIVKRDLPDLQKSTSASFEEENQACASIPDRIPATFQYYLFNDPGIPKTWKYSYLVYFSRVGFNQAHTQALVNVGLFSATNASDSEGKYLILNKVSGKWVLGDSSTIWQLSAQN